MKRNRGLSTIVGAAIAVAILIYFLNGVFLWTFAVERSMRQLEDERLNERLEVSAVYNVTSESSNVTVRNVGPVEVKLIRVWYGHEYVDLDESIQAGGYVDVSGLWEDHWIPEEEKIIKLVTVRGRIFTGAFEFLVEEIEEFEEEEETI